MAIRQCYNFLKTPYVCVIIILMRWRIFPIECVHLLGYLLPHYLTPCVCVHLYSGVFWSRAESTKDPINLIHARRFMHPQVCTPLSSCFLPTICCLLRLFRGYVIDNKCQSRQILMVCRSLEPLSCTYKRPRRLNIHTRRQFNRNRAPNFFNQNLHQDYFMGGLPYSLLPLCAPPVFASSCHHRFKDSNACLVSSWPHQL
jgi:hypothetical protein